MGQNQGDWRGKTIGYQGKYYRGGRIRLSQTYGEERGIAEQDCQALLWRSHEIQQDF